MNGPGEVIQQRVGEIGAAAREQMRDVDAFISDTGNSIQQGIGAFGAAAREQMGGVDAFVSDVGESIQQGAEALGSAAHDFVESVSEGDTTLLKGGISNDVVLKGSVSKTLSLDVGNSVSSATQGSIVSNIGSIVGKAASSAGSSVASAINTIGSGVSSAISGIGSGVMSAVSKVGGFMSGLFRF